MEGGRERGGERVRASSSLLTPPFVRLRAVGNCVRVELLLYSSAHSERKAEKRKAPLTIFLVRAGLTLVLRLRDRSLLMAIKPLPAPRDRDRGKVCAVGARPVRCPV
eukprot:scaffold89954_cov41-Tisochrysis_lutea.AAC.1